MWVSELLFKLAKRKLIDEGGTRIRKLRGGRDSQRSLLILNKRADMSAIFFLVAKLVIWREN